MFRLVGGMHPPIPPLNPPLAVATPDDILVQQLKNKKFHPSISQQLTTNAICFSPLPGFVFVIQHFNPSF